MPRDNDETFEAFLAGCTAVEVPIGVRERILAPALALADLSDARRERRSLGEWLVGTCEVLFVAPVRLLAIAVVLVTVNVVVDDLTPCLVDDIAAGRMPGPAVATSAMPVDGRGWFIDARTFDERHPITGPFVAPGGARRKPR